VERGDAGPVPDSVAGLADSPTQVEVLAEQEVPLVQAAPGRLERAAAQHQEGTGAAVHVVRDVGVEKGQVVAPQDAALWKEPADSELLGQRGHHRRLRTPTRRVDAARGQQ
jgi:hypothetical protein